MKCYLHKGDNAIKSPIWLRASQYALVRCKPIKINGEIIYEVLEEGLSVACLNFPDNFILLEHENVKIENRKAVTETEAKMKYLKIKHNVDDCATNDNLQGYPHYVLKTGRFDIVPYADFEMEKETEMDID